MLLGTGSSAVLEDSQIHGAAIIGTWSGVEGSVGLCPPTQGGPLSHGRMWPEGGHVCCLPVSRQAHPQPFMERSFPEYGLCIIGIGKIILIGTWRIVLQFNTFFLFMGIRKILLTAIHELMESISWTSMKWVFYV